MMFRGILQQLAAVVLHGGLYKAAAASLCKEPLCKCAAGAAGSFDLSAFLCKFLLGSLGLMISFLKML